MTGVFTIGPRINSLCFCDTVFSFGGGGGDFGAMRYLSVVSRFDRLSFEFALVLDFIDAFCCGIFCDVCVCLLIGAKSVELMRKPKCVPSSLQGGVQMV